MQLFPALLRFRFLLGVLFLFLYSSFFAQESTLDSLKREFKNAKHDTTRAAVLLLWGADTYLQQPDTAFAKWQKAASVSEEALKKCIVGSKEYQALRKAYAKSQDCIGYVYKLKGDLAKTLAYSSRSLKIQEEIGDKEGMASSLNNIASVYIEQGDVPRALDYFGRCLKIREEIGDKEGAAIALNNIGYIYQNQGDYAKALDYFMRCLNARKEAGNKDGTATSLNNIGVIYKYQGNFSEALNYMEMGLKIREEIGDQRGIAQSLNNIGTIYRDQGQLAKARDYYGKSLKIREEIADKKGIANSRNNIGTIYFKEKNYAMALTFAGASMQAAKELGAPLNIQDAALLLNKVYKATGNYKLALENYELYIQMRDSVANEQNRKASIKSQLKYEYEKKAAADSVKNAEQQKVKDAALVAQNAQIKQERFQRYSLIVGLFVVLGGLVFVINRFRVTSKQKKIIEEQKIKVDEAFEKLEEKNKEVMDSIYYARRIQRALITSEKYIERNLRKLISEKA